MSSGIGGHVAVSAKTTDYYFPLYLYDDADPQDLFAGHEPGAKRSNVNPDLVQRLTAAYGYAPAPEAVLGYVYAVLHSPAYRAEFAEFLRLDFPRVPFASSAAVFEALAAEGGRLIALHLLESPELDPPACRYPVAGDNTVRTTGKTGLRYDGDRQRVYINADQYFEPVPPAVWALRVGGYQPADRWLRDRRGRQLSLDDVQTYCRIISAMGRTIEVQAGLDALLAPALRDPLPLKLD